jgi:hypothetical protein
MSVQEREEKLVTRKVTYTLYKDGQFYIIENVPARVDEETGEQYFSPRTVENLHQIIAKKKMPVREVMTPVFQFT